MGRSRPQTLHRAMGPGGAALRAMRKALAWWNDLPQKVVSTVVAAWPQAPAASSVPPYSRPRWRPPPPAAQSLSLAVGTFTWWELTPPTPTCIERLRKTLLANGVDVCCTAGLPAACVPRVLGGTHGCYWTGHVAREVGVVGVLVKNSLRAWHRRLDPRQAQPRGPPSFGLPVSPSKQSTCLVLANGGRSLQRLPFHWSWTPK